MGQTTPDDVLEAMIETLRNVSPRPVVTAQEIAERLPVSPRTVRNRLDVLEAGGDLGRFEAGASAVVWYLVDEADRDDRGAVDELVQEERDDVLDDVDDHPPDAGGVEADAFDSVEQLVGDEFAKDEVPIDVEDILEQLELPGSGKVLEERRQAVKACYTHLREEGEATKSDFIRDIFPDHSASYGSEGGWWNAIGKEGLRVLANELDEVRAPSEGRHQWLFTD